MLACSVLTVVLAPVTANAEELWDPHLRGVNEGLEAGGLPPAGFYFINNAYWADYKAYDQHGDSVPGVTLKAFVDVPILLWSTGKTVLGAQYAAGIAQPFDYTNLNVAGANYSSNWGLYNTVIIPGILSWKVSNDVFVAASLSYYAKDGTSAPGHHTSTKNAAWSANGYSTIEPGLGITWANDGWNVSADMHYSIPNKNTDTGYKSAPEFWADLTAAKTVNKWTWGVGAYLQQQTSKDKLNGVKVANSAVSNFGIGPIVGYNFGSFIVNGLVNWNVKTKNDVGGSIINVRVIVPMK